MDTRLAWHQRLGMRFHLLYCVWCRRYASQIHLLRKATKGLGAESLDPSAPKLSDQAKEQMRHRLQEAVKNPPSSPH
jgi:hypothetical protein